MENRAENQEVKAPEVIDILSRGYGFHWTQIEKLGKILSRGIYSSAFAQRVGDQEFSSRTYLNDRSEKRVFITSNVNAVFSTRNKESRLVAIIVNTSGMFPFASLGEYRVPLRIAPRQIIGLVVLDKSSSDELDHHIPYFDEISTPKKARKHALKKVEQIIKFFDSGEQTKTGILPIYGISGDLYWPKRITHEEIVRMLVERQKQGQMAKSEAK